MLLHIPGVLSATQVADFRRQLDEADWTDGRATVGVQGARVKRNRQLDAASPLSLRLGEVVLKALASNPLFVSAALPLRTVPPLFNCYEGGENYGLHVDGAVQTVSMVRGAAVSTQLLRTDLSSTLFLCEPEEYDGGELVVVDTYGTHEVKLPAGDLILYPSSSLHRVEPVSRGQRIASFFWTQSMVRDDAKRGLLFEMDSSIQKLRQRIGDSEEVVSLTAQYHNLLRMWADI
jgi:PKHD-type hydroxylase